MITASEIAGKLAHSAEDITRMLLPLGKRDGAEWRVGSVEGEAGQSLGVRLTGAKAGTWRDFAADAGGDLLDLWAAVRGLSLRDAIVQAKAHLGLVEPRFEGYRPKTYRRPERPKCTAPQDAVAAYLHGRGLTEATLAAYRVAGRGREVVLPSLRDGALIALKYLGLERPGGKKQIRVEADCEPCLFGWQAMPPAARTVAITEGELDAMSLHQYGYPALSVPFGGGGGDKQRWIETEFEHLARFDVLYLCLDDDEQGQLATEEIANRLGRHRCRRVELPRKDANECLQAGVSAELMQACFAAAFSLDPVELRNAESYVAEVIGEFYPPPGSAVKGFCTPWPAVDASLRFRPGEITAISGVNGHGKTVGVGHLTLAALAQDQRACVASLEFKPRKWLMALTRQCGGLSEPSIPYIRAIHAWFGERLWVFDVTERAKPDSLLEVFEYAARRYRINLFVIDNLTRLSIPLDDYNGQHAFVNRLADFARNCDVHVFLVVHPRKAADDSRPGGKLDVRGSGAITDLVDNVLVWWRNRKKEELVRQGSDDPAELAKPDAYVICEKQRGGDDEPRVKLWFERGSHQFLAAEHGRAKHYVALAQAVPKPEQP